MQRGPLLPLLPPPLLPGGEDGGGRRGGSGDSAHGRRGAAENRPPQGRHLVREGRGARADLRGLLPSSPASLGWRRDRPPFPQPSQLLRAARPPACAGGCRERGGGRAGCRGRGGSTASSASRRPGPSAPSGGDRPPRCGGSRLGLGCWRPAGQGRAAETPGGGRHRGQLPAGRRGRGREGRERRDWRGAEPDGGRCQRGARRPRGACWTARGEVLKRGLRRRTGCPLCSRAFLPLSRLKGRNGPGVTFKLSEIISVPWVGMP